MDCSRRSRRVETGAPPRGDVFLLLIGGITDPALAALPSRPVTLYRSSDGHIPDWNDAIGYTAPWGLDRLIVNPHTGSQIVVAGRHVWILNPNLRLGVRDAIRVIKQLVTTTFEVDGAVVMHAAAFAVDDGAVALVGSKGSGKTTTVLAAVASGATLISNDRLYAWPTNSQTMVVGWTDPLRVIDASPEAPKRMIPLIQYAHNDRSQVTEQPLPLVAVVVPDVRPGLSPPRMRRPRRRHRGRCGPHRDLAAAGAVARCGTRCPSARRRTDGATLSPHLLRLPGRPPGRRSASRHATRAWTADPLNFGGRDQHLPVANNVMCPSRHRNPQLR